MSFLYRGICTIHIRLSYPELWWTSKLFSQYNWSANHLHHNTKSSQCG